jgi:hypothetical protein
MNSQVSSSTIVDDSEWCESTVLLLSKWETVCRYRKKAHYSSAGSYGWKNKLLSIPTILISTVLGSLSFIQPTVNGQSSARRLQLSDPYNGDCSIPCGAASGECPDLGIGQGFWNCVCCYDYWEGCSATSCSGWCYDDCGGGGYYTGEPTSSLAPTGPTTMPSLAPTYAPSYIPSRTPTYAPSLAPTYAPSYIPSRTPTYAPSFAPTYAPSLAPTYAPSFAPTYGPTDSAGYLGTTTPINYFPYIIGIFNMIIAILSALQAFLKYDALEDRHHQYSRHFGNLQVDLETLLAKPIQQRGNAGTIVERYKTKYAVLINNAPELPEPLERTCCGAEEGTAIELT